MTESRIPKFLAVASVVLGGVGLCWGQGMSGGKAEESARQWAESVLLSPNGAATTVWEPSAGKLIGVSVDRAGSAESSAVRMSKGQAKLRVQDALVEYVVLAPVVGDDWQAVGTELAKAPGGWIVGGDLKGVHYRNMIDLPDTRVAVVARGSSDRVVPTSYPSSSQIADAHRRVILRDLLAGTPRSDTDISKVIGDLSNMIAQADSPADLPPRGTALLAASVLLQRGDQSAAATHIDNTSLAPWDLSWSDLQLLEKLQRALGRAAEADQLLSMIKAKGEDSQRDPRLAWLAECGGADVPVGFYEARVDDRVAPIVIIDAIEMDFREGEPAWLRPALQHSVQQAMGGQQFATSAALRVGGVVSTTPTAARKIGTWKVISVLDSSTPEAAHLRYVLVEGDAPTAELPPLDMVEVQYRDLGDDWPAAQRAVRLAAIASHASSIPSSLLSDLLSLDGEELAALCPTLQYEPSSFGVWRVGIDSSAVDRALVSLLPPGSVPFPVAVRFDADSELSEDARGEIAEAVLAVLCGWASPVQALRVVAVIGDEPLVLAINIGSPVLERGERKSQFAGQPPKQWMKVCRSILIRLYSSDGIESKSGTACTQQVFGERRPSLGRDQIGAVVQEVLRGIDVNMMQEDLLDFAKKDTVPGLAHSETPHEVTE